MDRRRVAKNSRRRRKKNVDNTQQSKEPGYFPNDTILEAAKFLTYEKWSEMRFLCRRVNQLIQSNQSKLQDFEVRSLEMSDVLCKSNSIISFDQGIQSPVAMRKWFQGRAYSGDETTDIPLEKVFAGLNLYEQFNPNPGVRVDVRAYFDEPTEKSMPLIRGQAKRTGKARKKNRYLPNAARSEPPKVFSAKFNDKYQFYGPILSHFFRLLHHPAVYFRKVSIFPPMTDKFCDITTHSPIRCDKFTLTNFDCSLEHSLKWLKDNVRAQQIILITNSDHFLSSEHHTLLSEFILQDASICAEDPSDLHSLVSEFILQNASICAQDRIILDWLPHPGKFVKALIKKYETLEVTKPIPSIVLEFKLGHVEIQLKCSELNLEDYEYPKFFMPDLEPIRYPPLYDKRCDRCDIKNYERPIKLDGSRKMIAQVRRCFHRDCLRGDYAVYGTSDIPTERIVSNVERLYSRTFQHESNRATTEGTSSNSIAQECFRKQRLNRFITDHLLRAGYFATAQKLSEYAGTDFSCHKYIFHVAKQVEESLARKDLSICLNWITDNRSKLHRLNSTFETEVRIQQCVELIRNGRKLDAINSSKSFFGNLPAKQWKEGNLLSLFGLLGLGLQDGIPNEPYQKLLNDDRYDYLIDLFRRENQRIFQISSQSPFSACLHAGLAAHKTPHCRRNAASKCVVCSDLYDLAEGLPVAHASNSRLICAASGEPLNEENQPMMLPNGRVYGEKSIHRLTKDREICCPRTNEVFSVDDIKRVYVL